MTKEQTKTITLLLSVLNNPRFQFDLHMFRQRWGIPRGGFETVTEYEEWIKTKNRSYSSLYTDLERVLSKAHLLKSESVGRMLLITYFLRNKIEIFPEKVTMSSKPKLSGFLGFVEDITFLSFLAGADENHSQDFQKFLEFTEIFKRDINIKLNQQKIDDSYLAAVPGNPADGVFATQRNIEDLIERGVASLRHTIKNIKDFSINKYEDKNKHIDGEVQQTGTFALNRGLYVIAEIYWLAIAQEIEKINGELQVELNKGIPLANAGVAQLAQDKVLDGLRNLFFALKDDEKVLIALQVPNTDPAKNLVNTFLYTQFEKRLNTRIIKILGTSSINLDSTIDLTKTIESLLSGLEPDKRLFFFYLLAEFFSTLEKKDVVSDDLLSRSIVLRVLGGYASWLEDLLKKKYSTVDQLYQLFEKHLHIPMSLLSGYNSHSLDELELKINTVVGNSKITEEVRNAQVTTLIRNFAMHNFQTESHDFYSKSVEYFSRMVYLALKLHSQSKL